MGAQSRPSIGSQGQSNNTGSLIALQLTAPTAIVDTRKKTQQPSGASERAHDGTYINKDYRPRRDSSVARLKRILDRIRPATSPPTFNTGIYGAMTGASPAPRSPVGVPSRCSEDGHVHECMMDRDRESPAGRLVMDTFHADDEG